MPLAFSLQTDMNQIFQMRYCASLLVKKLQKYQRSKLEFDKKPAGSAGPGCIEFEMGRVGSFLCDLQLWPQIFLQPLDLQECTVNHCKDLIHISLEPEAQGCSMTFNRFYIGSKYPYFISCRGKWMYLFYHRCTKIGQNDVKCQNCIQFLYFLQHC